MSVTIDYWEQSYVVSYGVEPRKEHRGVIICEGLVVENTEAKLMRLLYEIIEVFVEESLQVAVLESVRYFPKSSGDNSSLIRPGAIVPIMQPGAVPHSRDYCRHYRASYFLCRGGHTKTGWEEKQ